jgi:protein-tyrosine phosphatase
MFRSILVVCVGNICRSPVGAQILRQNLSHLNIGSAGLHGLVGEGADPLAREAAALHGVDLSGHVARQLTPELGAAHDLLLVMEKAHRTEIAQRMPQLVGRTVLFGQWIDGGIDIPDPYRRTREVHAQTVALIKRAADAWSDRLKPKE